MQFLPIEYFEADLTRWHPLLQWIEFRGGRHWISRSEKDLAFKAGFASDEFEFSIDTLKIKDGYGKELPFEIEPLESAPEGFSDFDWLPASNKSLVKIRVPFQNDQLEAFPILGQIQMPDKTQKSIFSIRPTILYPDFIFKAISAYASKLAPRFTDFVETGTLFGHTTIHASYWFDRVTTIELSESLYGFIENLPEARPNVTIVKGDSSKALPDILTKLEGPTVFFLDAHWSGDNSTNFRKFEGYPHPTSHTGTDISPKPVEQKPLLTELERIYEGCEFPAILILDDWDIFGQSEHVFEGFDWTHLTHEGVLKFIAEQPRTVFHERLGEARYIIGLR